MKKNTTIESVISNLKRVSGLTVEVKTSFLVNDTPYRNEDGYVVYPEKSIEGILVILLDDTGEERPRVVRQVAFDISGNHYRFCGSCQYGPIFELTPKDGYDGFTALEAIELVRLRDAIIAV